MGKTNLTLYQRTAKSGQKYYAGTRDGYKIAAFKGKVVKDRDGNPQPTLSVVLETEDEEPPAPSDTAEDGIPF